MALVSHLLFCHQTLRDLNRVISRERGIANSATCACCIALGHPDLALVRFSLVAKQPLPQCAGLSHVSELRPHLYTSSLQVNKTSCWSSPASCLPGTGHVPPAYLIWSTPPTTFTLPHKVATDDHPLTNLLLHLLLPTWATLPPNIQASILAGSSLSPRVEEKLVCNDKLRTESGGESVGR